VVRLDEVGQLMDDDVVHHADWPKTGWMRVMRWQSQTPADPRGTL
jgi:hypothetical protein